MNPKILASAPAWLKKSLAEKIMTETDPVKIREAQMALETIKRSEQMVGGGLTPEQAGALLQNLHRQVSDPALPPLPSMRQQPLDYAKGGSVPETRSVVRLPQRQREMNRAMNIIASQRYSPSMTSGAPKTRGLDALTKGLIGAPMIGALTASPMSGPGRSAIAKLAKMLAGGSRKPGVVGAGAGIGAATELLEDDPTLAGALTNAALFAADVAAPIPTLAGQVLGYSPDAEAGGGSLIRKGLEKWGRRAARGMVDDAVESLPGQLSVVKPKGGNWLSGSVEDSLGGLKRDFGSIGRGGAPHPHDAALNSWIEGPLTKYVKNLMATPEDPVRALAERGVLHFEPRAGASVSADASRHQARRSGSMPMAGTTTPFDSMGRRWEDVADATVSTAPYLDHLPLGSETASVKTLLRNKFGDYAAENPDTLAHSLNRGSGAEGLGFNHLIDELGNAINPESGLPAHLQFPSERLGKVSVPQAVERVSQINAWRAAQKAEADMLRANNAATVLHKEYPENNPLGLSWKELKALDDTPEGRQALADALKYEGDTMGHCVGGYCDEVLSGKSRIFSLRDTKGEPHVTVEVAPEGRAVNAWVPEGEEPSALPSIVQIKGKQNRAPNPEYLPFVQDFVRNSPFGKGWSNVGDLQNTRLRRSSDVWNDLERAKIKESGRDMGDYVTDDEINLIGNSVWPGKWGKFAKGGSVNSPGNRPLTQSDLHAMIAALEAQVNA